MNPHENNHAEISLKEIFMTIKEYWLTLWRNWLLIGLIALPFVAFFYFKAVSTPTKYNAEIRFIIEGQSGSSFGGLGGLLGTFGIGGSDGKTNPFKILEVAKSNRMVGELIFSKSELDSVIIANKIIDAYKFDERWEKSQPKMVGLRFNNPHIETLTKEERKAFLSVLSTTIGIKETRENALVKISLDDDTAIFSMKAKTVSETLSLDLVNTFYEKVKYFFEEQVLEDQKRTRDLLKEKADSLEYVISQKTLEIARYEDRSKFSISSELEFSKNKKLLEIQGLSAAYAESLKTYEIADYKYKDRKPLFLTIDRPYAPLTPLITSWLFNVIIGLILGALVGATFVIGRKIVRDALKE